jgi:hypothetical protein
MCQVIEFPDGSIMTITEPLGILAELEDRWRSSQCTSILDELTIGT